MTYSIIYQRERRDIKRYNALIALGGCCAKCASVDKLQFDHIDRTTKVFDISQGLDVGKEKFEAELAKCQLLCQPCHSKKTNKEMGRREQAVHGTPSRYSNQGCRCAECVNAWRIYWLLRRRLWRNKKRKSKI